MAKIEPIKSTPVSGNQGNAQNFTNKLMPPGEYIGKIVDVGFATDQNQTRNILYVTVARSDKEHVSPRIIRARFDIWNQNIQIYQYAITNLFYFQKAVGLEADLDTDDPKLLEIIIKAALFKNVVFVVEKIVSQQGHTFNVVKHFKELERTPNAPGGASSPQSQAQPNPAAFPPPPVQEATTPALDNWIDDDVPF